MDLIPRRAAGSLEALESGTAVWRPQNKAERTYFHKRSARDSLIDWSWPAEDLERFVRALSEPYPRAFSFYRGERIEVLEATRLRRAVRRHAGPGDRAGGRRRRGVRPLTHIAGGNHALVITRVRGERRSRAPRRRVLSARRLPHRQALAR